MELDDGPRSGGLGAAPPSLQWKVGLEPPPFVRTNEWAVMLLKAIVDGTAEAVPTIAISRAVAVQIYRLIFVQDARSPLLAGSAARGLYIILASLAHGTRTEPPDSDAHKALYLLLSRKSKPLGHAVQFLRITVDHKQRDPELRSLPLLDARRALFQRWDSV